MKEHRSGSPLQSCINLSHGFLAFPQVCVPFNTWLLLQAFSFSECVFVYSRPLTADIKFGFNFFRHRWKEQFKFLQPINSGSNRCDCVCLVQTDKDWVYELTHISQSNNILFFKKGVTFKNILHTGRTAVSWHAPLIQCCILDAQRNIITDPSYQQPWHFIATTASNKLNKCLYLCCFCSLFHFYCQCFFMHTSF